MNKKAVDRQHFNLRKDFFSIENFKRGDDEFDEFKILLNFEVNIKNLLDDDATNVKISILNKDEQTRNQKLSISSAIPTRESIFNLSSKKKLQQSVGNTKMILAQKNLSVIGFIDKTQIREVTNGAKVKKLVTAVTNKGTDDLKSTYKSAPVMSSIIEKQKLNFNLKRLLMSGYDPSDVRYVKDTFRSAADNFIGIKRSNQKDVVDARISTYADTLIRRDAVKNSSEDFKSNQQISIFSTAISEVDFLSIKDSFMLRLPSSMLTNDSIVFKITSYDSAGQELSTLNRDLNLLDELRVVLTPKIPPRVNSSRSGNKIKFIIHSDDVAAKGVDVFFKSVNFMSPESGSDYSKITSYEFESSNGGQITFEDIDFFDKEQIGVMPVYRFVPYGRDVDGNKITTSIFKNKVVLNFNSDYGNFVAISAQSTNEGVQLDIGKLPPDAVNARISRRSADRHDDKFIPIQDLNGVNDPNLRLDANVVASRLYEYRLDIEYADGIIRPTSSCIIRFYPPIKVGDKNPLSISNVIAQKDPNKGMQPNVVFDMSFIFQPTDNDLLKEVLNNRGITQFDEILKNNIDNLGDVISYQVSRTNLSTGEVNVFSTTTQPTFNDIEATKVDNIPSIKEDTDYKYEVRVFARNPQTIVKDLKISVTSSKGTVYQYSPYKFMNPYTLAHGIILGDDGGGSLITSKNFMELGDVGIFTSFKEKVKKDESQNKISNFSSKRIKNNIDLISWSYDTAAPKIDHFVVIRNLLDENYIDAVVTPDENGKVSFYNILPDDAVGGATTYKIYGLDVDYNIFTLN
jgi:hypothetical protein